ncbi:MAG: iron-sulfur cluster assembly accessory protein [Planctomycetaceae bacterium]
MPAVTITEKAAAEIKRFLSEQELPDTTHVRIGVSGGGCSGVQYSFNFDPDTNAEIDDLSEQYGVNVAMNKQFALHLDGTVIDFKDELHERGFVFQNPNVVRSCGCGKASLSKQSGEDKSNKRTSESISTFRGSFFMSWIVGYF